PLRLVSVLAQQGQLGVQARLETAGGGAFRVTVHVEPGPRHRIDGLLFQPLAARLSSWNAVDGALRRLAGRAGLYAGTAGGKTLHALAAHRAGAIGSAFKLYVLGALADAVAGGRARWSELLPIRSAWKSLPSGDMRNRPAGARFTLRRYAAQMISVSDNTAADHLIGRLGRPAVEAELTRLRNSVRRRNEPFLTTREFFALKLAAPPELRDAFAAAGPSGRRRLLPRVDALRPTLAQAASWKRPRAIDRLEWFAAPADLARALAALVARAREPGLAPLRPVLGANAGIDID